MVGKSFSFGEQIYSQHILPNSEYLECSGIQNVSFQIYNNILRLHFLKNSSSSISQKKAFALIHIILRGSLIEEDLRFFDSIHMDLINSKKGEWILDFPFDYARNFSANIYCVDQLILSTTISPIQDNIKNQDLQYSVFTIERNDGSLSNICVQNHIQKLFLRTYSRIIEDYYLPNQETFYQGIDSYIQNPYNITLISQGTSYNFYSSIKDFTLGFIINLFYYPNSSNDTFYIDDSLKNYTSYFEKASNKAIVPLIQYSNNYCYQYPGHNIIPLSWKNISQKSLIQIKKRFYERIPQTLQRNLILWNKKHSSEIIIDNYESILNLLNQFGNTEVISLNRKSIPEKLNYAIQAKLFLSIDDDQELATAYWLPENSTIIVFYDSNRNHESETLQFLHYSQIKIIKIPVKIEYENNIPHYEIPIELLKNTIQNIYI